MNRPALLRISALSTINSKAMVLRQSAGGASSFLKVSIVLTTISVLPDFSLLHSHTTRENKGI